jgi:hypothetical protein
VQSRMCGRVPGARSPSAKVQADPGTTGAIAIRRARSKWFV